MPESETQKIVFILNMEEILKTAIKKANAAVAANSPDKEAAVKFAIKKVDQACAKNLLHKNNAARKKSALAKLLAD